MESNCILHRGIKGKDLTYRGGTSGISNFWIAKKGKEKKINDDRCRRVKRLRGLRLSDMVDNST
jgi:hypothetical protein